MITVAGLKLAAVILLIMVSVGEYSALATIWSMSDKRWQKIVGIIMWCLFGAAFVLSLVIAASLDGIK